MSAASGIRIFVDSGFFIEFILRADEKHYSRALGLFEAARKNELKLETSEGVIMEVVESLEMKYGFARRDAAEVVEAILNTRSMKVSNSSVIQTATELYSNGSVGFPDACIAAHMKSRGCKLLATFERKKYRAVEGLEFYD